MRKDAKSLEPEESHEPCNALNQNCDISPFPPS
jgi:hypothetical protein